MQLEQPTTSIPLRPLGDSDTMTASLRVANASGNMSQTVLNSFMQEHVYNASRLGGSRHA
jgi:hypothetical protein